MDTENSQISRRRFVGLMGAALVTGAAFLTGCSSNTTSASSTAASGSAAGASSDSGSASAAEEGSTAASASAAADSSNAGKVLVAYYSATGNTQRVAKELASHLDADLFEVTPKDPYTEDDLDWNDDDSRVSQEYNDPSKRDVPLSTTAPDNFDSYDSVFIGYPIWWGDAAWPLNHFAQDNDFSGKKIAAFCTSLSSGIGSSADNVIEMCGGGNLVDSQRFGENSDLSDIDAWADSIDWS
ncbi:MAG: flavodoxin [Eggerthellaceae bacterium]|jgi:hypothetical protein